MTDRPKERGRLILRPSEKRGYCSACDATPKPGTVTASDLWARMRARGSGFVHISEGDGAGRRTSTATPGR